MASPMRYAVVKLPATSRVTTNTCGSSCERPVFALLGPQQHGDEIVTVASFALGDDTVEPSADLLTGPRDVALFDDGGPARRRAPAPSASSDHCRNVSRSSGSTPNIVAMTTVGNGTASPA